MLTDLQWKYAKHQRDAQADYRWGQDYHDYSDAKLYPCVAFDDMEQRQLEQDIYDEFENPRHSPAASFEHHLHHHELAEPVPQHQLDVERITELLENTHG